MSLYEQDTSGLFSAQVVGLAVQNTFLVLSLPVALVHILRCLKYRKGWFKASSIIVFGLLLAFLLNSAAGILFRGRLIKWARRTDDFPQGPHLYQPAQFYNITLTLCVVGADIFFAWHLYVSWYKNWRPMVFIAGLFVIEIGLTIWSNIPPAFYQYGPRDPMARAYNAVSAICWCSWGVQGTIALHILWILVHKRTEAIEAVARGKAAPNGEQPYSLVRILVETGFILLAIKTSSFAVTYESRSWRASAIASGLVSSFSFIVPAIIDVLNSRPEKKQDVSIELTSGSGQDRARQQEV